MRDVDMDKIGIDLHLEQKLGREPLFQHEGRGGLKYR